MSGKIKPPKAMSIAAFAGDAEAQFLLGEFYLKSARRGDSQDFLNHMAVGWLEEAQAQKHVGAILKLADCYAGGRGVGRDPNMVLALLYEAAELGSLAARNEIGKCCAGGIGTARNLPEAMEWYRRAAEPGVGGALRNIFVLASEALCLPPQEQRKVFEALTDPYAKRNALGYASGITDADALGTCYVRVDGVKRDYAGAAEWYARAADQGSDEAMRRLFKMGERCASLKEAKQRKIYAVLTRPDARERVREDAQKEAVL